MIFKFFNNYSSLFVILHINNILIFPNELYNIIRRSKASGFSARVIIFSWDEIMLSSVFFRRVLSLIICTFSTGSYFSGLILFINFQKIEVYKKKNVYRLLLFCLFRYYDYLIHVHLHYADNFLSKSKISIRNLLLQIFVWNGNPYTII